jgi:CheY-like chemotaxis protein
MSATNNEEKVLVIDDEPFAREFFRKLLEKTVAQIHTVESGVEGIQALQQSSYSLVILDIRLNKSAKRTL